VLLFLGYRSNNFIVGLTLPRHEAALSNPARGSVEAL